MSGILVELWTANSPKQDCTRTQARLDRLCRERIIRGFQRGAADELSLNFELVAKSLSYRLQRSLQDRCHRQGER